MRMKSPKHRPAGRNPGAEAVNDGRRGVFALVAAAPLLLLGLGARRAEAQAAACFDPNTLPAAQKSMRRTLNFKLQGPDPKKKCSLCAFYKPPGANCGKCDLLSGGMVAAASVCDSWAAKS